MAVGQNFSADPLRLRFAPCEPNFFSSVSCSLLDSHLLLSRLSLRFHDFVLYKPFTFSQNFEVLHFRITLDFDSSLRTFTIDNRHFTSNKFRLRRLHYHGLLWRFLLEL